MAAGHPYSRDGHRDSGDQSVGHRQGDHVDVVWCVETHRAEVARDDDQVDGEAQADDKNHRDERTIFQDDRVFIKPPDVPHPAVEQCEVLSEAGGGGGGGAGYVSLGKHPVLSVRVCLSVCHIKSD